MTKTNVSTRHDPTTNLTDNQYRLFTLIKTQRWLRSEGHVETANDLQSGIEKFRQELGYGIQEMMPITIALQNENII